MNAAGLRGICHITNVHVMTRTRPAFPLSLFCALVFITFALSLFAASVARADGEPGSLECGNGVDDDRDGYVDLYDSDCGVVTPTDPPCSTDAPSSRFTIEQRGCTDPEEVRVDARSTIAAADIDGDGDVEYVVREDQGRLSGDPDDFQYRISDTFVVIDAQTLAVESRIQSDLTEVEVFHPGVSIGQLDGSGPLEVAWVATDQEFGRTGGEYRLLVARLDGDSWTVTASAPFSTLSPALERSLFDDDPCRGWSTSIADIDQDGTAEVIAGNTVWRFTSGLTDSVDLVFNGRTVSDRVGNSIGGTDARGLNQRCAMSIAMDVLDTSPGLEIIAGDTVYLIDTTGANWTATTVQLDGGRDGWTSIADMNLDGQLDVVFVAHDAPPRSQLVIWDPATQTQLAKWQFTDDRGQETNFGRAAIGEFHNDGATNLPEILFVTKDRLRAYNLTDDENTLWDIEVADRSSMTRATIFDLNADGTAEIIYRDQESLRVMYGGPIAEAPANVNTTNRNYRAGDADVTIECESLTRLEGPIVLDTDGDGATELVVTCEPSVCEFQSVSELWAPARPIWNQYYYHVTNVDDDGGIPSEQQSILADFPEGSERATLNAGMRQTDLSLLTSPPGIRASIDLTVRITSYERGAGCGTGDGDLVVNYEIANDGSAPSLPSIPVAFYNGDPSDGGVLIQVETPGSVGAGASAGFSVTLPDETSPYDLFVVVNDDGSSPGAPVLLQPECDEDNNGATEREVFCCADDTVGGTDTSCTAETSCREDAVPAGMCVECTADEDCAEGDTCEEFACQRCDGDICGPPCESDADCLDGVCDESRGICVDCAGDEDCEDGVCDPETAMCAPECVEDMDCADGETCRADGTCGECIGDDCGPMMCVDDVDCPSGVPCEMGRCGGVSGGSSCNCRVAAPGDGAPLAWLGLLGMLVFARTSRRRAH